MLTYGTDPQADAEFDPPARYPATLCHYGEQHPDTDGLAAERDALLAELRIWRTRAYIAEGRLGELAAAPAPRFPARALRPAGRVGGLFCPF